MSDKARVGDRCPCGIYDENCEHCQCRDVEIDRLRERIEELEEINAKHVLNRIEEEGKRYEIEDGYIITRKQINAAWRYAMSVGEEYSRDRGVALEALKRIGIVRCGGCNGSGSAVHDDPECGIHEFECPTCNGHKWVKESDDV